MHFASKSSGSIPVRALLLILAAAGALAAAFVFLNEGPVDDPPERVRPTTHAPHGPAPATEPFPSAAHQRSSAPLTLDGFSLPTLPQSTPKPATADVLLKLRDSLKRNPADVKARIQLAAVLDTAGEASEAEDVLRGALQRGQKTPEVFHALGTVYLRNGIHAGASQAFLAETKLAPKNPDAHFALGMAYLKEQRTDEARREFENARKLNSKNPDVYLYLAFVNNGSDLYPYAVKYLQEYIKRSPQPGPGYGLLSRVYLNMRVFDKSMEAGKKAVDSMPDNAYVWYNLGQAYLYQPDNRYLNEAVDALKKATSLLANWGSANFELGRAYARLGKNTEAVAAYREAVRSNPMNGRYQYQLGQALSKSGQAEEGSRVLAGASRLIDLNQRETKLLNQITAKPGDTKRLFELSQVYKQLGDYSRAASVLESSLQADPKDERARAELESIRRIAASPRP